VPGAAASGARNDVRVQASFTFTNASPSLGATYTLDDATIVSASALDLAKQVRNVTQSGSFGITNQAKSGETLEYRITFTNIGAAPIGNLTIHDVVPPFTAFVSAAAGTVPATLTACAKNSPANPAPAARVPCATVQASGGTGPLDWRFTGALQPGQSGAVVFSVILD